jgi:hypothetical protein
LLRLVEEYCIGGKAFEYVKGDVTVDFSQQLPNMKVCMKMFSSKIEARKSLVLFFTQFKIMKFS